MSETSPLSDQERVDLVAYLDGELGGEAARALEAKLSLNPEARAEADALRRTWELLDHLPSPEPSAAFTHRTMERLTLVRARDGGGRRWRTRCLAAGWAASLLLAGWAGYAGFTFFAPREPGERELVHDLRVIENKRMYDLVEDLDFWRSLDRPDLFGDDSLGS
jgi:anti-sigma factor RsiW